MLGQRIKTIIALALAFLAGASAISLRNNTEEIFDKILTHEDIYYLPPANWLRVFSVGYNEMAADLVWCSSLVYFGGKKHWKSKKGAPEEDGIDPAPAIHTVKYLGIASLLDPRFKAVYLDGARLTLHHKGDITRESVAAGIELLERGTKVYPEDGALVFNLGFFHYYEMPPFVDKEKEPDTYKYHQDEGTRLMQLASSLENAPTYVSLLSASLLKKGGADELVAEHLKNMLFKETDPQIRTVLEEQLRSTLGKLAESDIEASRELRARWLAQIPWMSFDFFLLTEPTYGSSYADILHPEDIKMAFAEPTEITEEDLE